MTHRIDLAKARHELRTPINHILGYCEILLEEEEMPEEIVDDLRKIYTGGQQLLELISRYFVDATFGVNQNWKQIQHELRTPVNHIIGFSELLMDQASELGQRALLADVTKIRNAARQWLELVESYLFEGGGLRGNETDWARPAEETEAQADAPPDPRLTEASLLVVDDDPSSRELLARRLHRAGFRVTTTASGAEALELLERHPIDLLLVDFVMPGMNGLELLERVRRLKSRTELPVIMVTGRDASGDVAHALRLGANDYVTKPVDFRVVLARLTTQLELRRAEEQSRDRLAEIQKLAEDLKVRNQFIQQVFGRYLTDEVVRSILEEPSGLELGGSKRVVTILMSDLRGFTGLAERLPPESVVELLNQYLGAMAAVIVQHHGTVDEFIGDAILAIFGAPLARADHAESAAACALAMQLEMERVNRRLSRLKIPPLEMGIGVNTGEVVVGNIGSDKRAKYGVVGAQVNLAGRIQSVTVGGEILLSAATAAALVGKLKTGSRVTIAAKGATAPLTLHSLVGLRGWDHLELPPTESTAKGAARSMAVTCFRLTDTKMVYGQGFAGQLTILGSRSGVLQSNEALQTRMDLKLTGASGEVYAKVMADDPEPYGREVRFTSALPEGWA